MNNDNEKKISKFYEFLTTNIEPNNIIKNILKYFLDILLKINQINDNMYLLNEQLKKFQDSKNEINFNEIKYFYDLKEEKKLKEIVKNFQDPKNENNFINEENDFYLIDFFDEILINNNSIIINLIKIYIGLEPISLKNKNNDIEINNNIFNNFKIVKKEIILNLIDFFLEFIYLSKKDYKDFFQYISNIYQLNKDFNEEIFHNIIIILKKIYIIKSKDLNFFLNKFYFSFFGNETIKIEFQYLNEKIQEINKNSLFGFFKKKTHDKQSLKNIIDDNLKEKNEKMKYFKNENFKKTSNFSFHFIFKNNLKNKINFIHNFVLLNYKDIFKISLIFSYNNLEINVNEVKKKNKKIKIDRTINIISIFFNSNSKTIDFYVNSSNKISEKINQFNELVNFELFNKFNGELYFFCFNFFKSSNHISKILQIHNKINQMISDVYFYMSKEFLINIYNIFLEYSNENNKNKDFDLDIIIFVPIINIKRKKLYENNYINEIINYNEGLIFLALFDCNIIFHNELSNNNINLIEKGGFKVFIPIIKIILDEYKNNKNYIRYFNNILEIFNELLTDSKNNKLFKKEKILDIICLLFDKYNLNYINIPINELFKLPFSSKKVISNIFEYKTIINNSNLFFVKEKILQLNFVLIEKIIIILNSLSDKNELYFNIKLKKIYSIFEEIYKFLNIDFKKIEEINLKDIFYISKKLYENNNELGKNENIYNNILFNFLLSNITIKIYYIDKSIYNEIKNDEQNNKFISKFDIIFNNIFIIENTIINLKNNNKNYFENFINLFSDKYIYFYFFYIYCEVHNINSDKIKQLLINVMKIFLENSIKNFEKFTFKESTFKPKFFMNYTLTKENKNNFLLFLYQFFISFPGYPKSYSLLNFYYEYFNEIGKTIDQNNTKEIKNEKINEIKKKIEIIKIVNFPFQNKKNYKEEIQNYQLIFPIEEEFFIFLFLIIELFIHKFKNIIFQKRFINIALIKLKHLLFYYLYIYSFIENKYEEYYKKLSIENPEEKQFYEERKNYGISYLKLKLKRYYTSIYCIYKNYDIYFDKFKFEDSNILKFEYLFSFFKENAKTNNAINSLFNSEKEMKLFLIINNIKTKRYYKKLIKELFINNGYYNIENIYQFNNNLSLFKINNFITNDLKMPLLTPMIDLDYYLFENNNEGIEYNIQKIIEKNITKFHFLFEIKNHDNKLLIDNIENVLEKNILNFKIKILDILKENCNLDLILSNKEKIIKILDENLYDNNLFNLLNDILNINNNISAQINNLKGENIDIINNIIFNLKDNILLNINLNELLLNNKYFNLFESLINNNNLSNYIYENYDTTKIYECCLVKKTHHIKGYIFLYNKEDNQKIIFISFYLNFIRENCNNLNKEKCYGSFLNIPFKDDLKIIKINVEDIDKIFEKKYFYSPTALELFTNYGKSYYINFKKKNDKNEFLKKIISNNFKTNYINYEKAFYSICNNLNSFDENENDKNINYNFNEWEDGLMTNYYLIMFLNLIGNRSFNDLFQYPVFPWISYYNENKKNYRKLKFPLGRMNQKLKIKYLQSNNENNVIIKYYKKNDKYYYDFNIEKDFCLEYDEIIKDEDIYSFYFNNYMNIETIKNYLLRIFPFFYINSAYFIMDEIFDDLNNYFYNKDYYTYTSKELIPEFYYLYELFINFNNLTFENKKLYNILLPKDLNKFKIIIDFFKDLESTNTSKTINYWIDLIFGYLQNTDDINFEKKKIKNKYRCESYLNKEYNEETILECFIEGVIPKQLFYEKFLSRKINRKNFPLNFDSLSSNIFSFPNCFLEHYMYYCYTIIIVNDIGISINVFDERIYIIYLNNINENIKQNEIIYYPIDGEITYKPIDANLLINYIKLNYHIIDINNKYIFMGGFKKGVIRYIINRETKDYLNEKKIKKKISYSDFLNLYNENKLNVIITAIISINYFDSFYIITGDNCGTIKFIKIIKENYKLNCEILKNIYEHSNEIILIKYNDNLNLWLSAGLDNIINIFTFKRCEKIGTINLMNEKINKLNYVNFSEYPLISIIIIYDNVLLSLSLNKEIINKKIINKNLNFENPIIIENADFSQNILFLEDNQNIIQFDLPFFEEINNNIKFKNKIEKFNVSLNNNYIIGIGKDIINNEKYNF